jgi:hypothetical protein
MAQKTMMGTTPLIEEMNDPAPVKLMPPPPVAVHNPAADKFPWGWLLKHPSFGAFRVRKDEAKSEAEAKEVYRKTRCPHMSQEALDRSGMRLMAVAFRPAATEQGK